MNRLDFNSMLKPLESFLKALNFLFFTAWGWLLILSIFLFLVFVNSRDERGRFSFPKFLSSFVERGIFLFINLSQFFLAVALFSVFLTLWPLVKEVKNIISDYNEIKTLSAVVKNLKSERKVLEIIPVSYENGEMTFKVKYFAYSPVKGKDIMTGEMEYKVYGKKAYFDFIVVNFDYSLVESGEKVNLALPYVIYSDKIPFENGVSIGGEIEKIPLSLKLDKEDLFLVDKKEYETVIEKLIKAVRDPMLARKLGIRTSYSEAIVVYPLKNNVYSVYSTATGGIILK